MKSAKAVVSLKSLLNAAAGELGTVKYCVGVEPEEPPPEPPPPLSPPPECEPPDGALPLLFDLPSKESVNHATPPTTAATPTADKRIICGEDKPLKNPYSSPHAAVLKFCLYFLICLSQFDASAPYICKIFMARLSLFITAVQTNDNPVAST